MDEQFSTKDLQTFVELANSASFTLAAENLHVTQSALSKRIADLELKLGVKLFDRTTRRLHLTVEGREFREMAEAILEQVRRSVSDLRQMAKGERGRLWMTAAPHLSSTLIPPVLAAFSARNPLVQIEYYDCRRKDMIRYIRTGSAEFGIIGGMIGQDHNFPAEFETTRILQVEQQMSVGFSPGHPLEEADVIRWEDLTPYKLISLRSSGGLGHMYKVVTQNMQVDLQKAIEVSIITTAMGMASNGLGIVIFPSYVVENFDSRRLTHRAIHGSRLDYEFAFLHLEGHSLSGAATSFGEIMRQRLTR